jgi:hypothetical protein
VSKTTLASTKALSDKLHGRWMREFAGRSRHTRDLAALDKLIEKANSLARKSKGLKGEKADEVEKLLIDRLRMYRTERGLIAEAVYERPEIAEVHGLGLEIDRALACWRRHFAGRDRRTRDLVMLDQAVIARLGRALGRMRELAGANPDLVKAEQLESLTGQFEVFKDERSEIDKARRAAVEAGGTAGSGGSDRAALLVVEAQQALERYRVHFAGQPRVACSLLRLDAIVALLGRVKGELEALPEAARAAQNENLMVLTNELAARREERAAIAEALAATTPRERGGQLGLVANQMFQVYAREFAGKDRATRNLALLGNVCDRLTDVAEQMAELERLGDDPVNRKNRPVVEDRERAYEREWVAIAQVKAEQAAKAAAAAPMAGKAAAGTARAPVASAAKITVPGKT